MANNITNNTTTMTTLESLPLDLFVELQTYLEHQDVLALRSPTFEQRIIRSLKTDPANPTATGDEEGHVAKFTPAGMLRLAAISKLPFVAPRIRNLKIVVDVPNQYGMQVLDKRLEMFNQSPGYKFFYEYNARHWRLRSRPNHHPAEPDQPAHLTIAGDKGWQFIDYRDQGLEQRFSHVDGEALQDMPGAIVAPYAAGLDGVRNEGEWPAMAVGEQANAMIAIREAMLYPNPAVNVANEDYAELAKGLGVSQAVSVIVPALASECGSLESLTIGSSDFIGSLGLWAPLLRDSLQASAVQGFRNLTTLQISLSDAIAYRQNDYDTRLSPAQAARPLTSFLQAPTSLTELFISGVTRHEELNHRLMARHDGLNGALEVVLANLRLPHLHTLRLLRLALTNPDALTTFIAAHNTTLTALQLSDIELPSENPSWMILAHRIGETVDLTE
ncbi:uncharacterized protein K452DRAFT_339488 [Aplosporella prunicola CBS 121167]|uniref:Uncharacterized protein n=1 Tax=Aplosporella prunicola CBS 121167 TaxID=1176127 RepID=A0A6A6B4F8_9PEZI|nr:uncharacterized protein K452DRAFT_339488 [Aplosporella prunicola CBS 121167]KAF2137847.1 hypothetical protein K452DRAFT_339488 [Aplosporella prunicola CBS 121167]